MLYDSARCSVIEATCSVCPIWTCSSVVEGMPAKDMVW